MYKLPIKNLDFDKIDIYEQLLKTTECLGIFKRTLNKLPNSNIILNDYIYKNISLFKIAKN